MKKLYSNSVKDGENILTEFVIRQKVLKEYEGKAFISFELSDKYGKLDGVYWGDDALERSAELEVGSVARIWGKVQMYKGRNQIRIEKIEKLSEGEYDIADFIPISRVPLDELWGSFVKAIDGISDENLRRLFGLIVCDEKMVRALRNAPGGKKWHHAYVGGLLEHTLSVCRIALTGIRPYPNVDRDIITAGALIHDIGKTKEFTSGPIFDYTEEGRLIGHIILGILIIEDYISKIPDFPSLLRMKLVHIIASHHGDASMGSPVKPMTVEAEIIFHADQLDAQANAFSHIIETESPEGKVWSNYVNLKDRYLYLR